MRAALLLLVFLVTSSTSSAADRWGQWRGPHRDGLVEGAAWPDSISGGALRLLWRVDDLGDGYSGPVVDDRFVYVTETRDEELEVVSAYARGTGELAWTTEWEGAMSVPFFAARNGSWIRATPALDHDRLYVAGMRDVLVCLDASSGDVLWRVDFVEGFGTPLPAFGVVSSPPIDGDHVYVQAGRERRGVRTVTHRCSNTIPRFMRLLVLLLTSLLPAVASGADDRLAVFEPMYGHGVVGLPVRTWIIDPRDPAAPPERGPDLPFGCRPVPSPDRRSVAFVGEEIEVAALLGGAAPRRFDLEMLPRPSDPSWSPDGSFLAFGSHLDTKVDPWAVVPFEWRSVQVLDLATGHAAPLGFGERPLAGPGGWVAWVHDGKVLVRKRSGAESTMLGEGAPIAFAPDGAPRLLFGRRGELRLVGLPAGRDRLVATGDAAPPRHARVLWTPDASRVVHGGPVHVEVWNAADGTRERLTSGEGGGLLGLSPDGRRVAALVPGAGDDAGGRAAEPRIVTIDLDTGEVVPLVTTRFASLGRVAPRRRDPGAEEEHPPFVVDRFEWSPDGRLVAFSTPNAGGYHRAVYLVDVERGTLVDVERAWLRNVRGVTGFCWARP